MSNDDDDVPSKDRMLEVRYEFTPILADILSHLKCSLMVTTYQAGKLLVLGVHNGTLKISFSNYDQPMGLAISGDRLAIGTRCHGPALAQALPTVSNSTLDSASLAETPDQTTNWNAWK